MLCPPAFLVKHERLEQYTCSIVIIINNFSLQQAILRAGSDAVDAARSALPGSWLDNFRNVVVAGVTVVTGGTRNRATASAPAPPIVRVIPPFLRTRPALLLMLLAAGVGSVYYWWGRRSR